jgi:hypothetical protein
MIDTGVSDEAKLESLLSCDDLTDEERKAFVSMQKQLKRNELTPKQKKWVSDVFERRELDAASTANLFSRGLVERGKPVKMSPLLDKDRLPKRPPGRRA